MYPADVFVIVFSVCDCEICILYQQNKKKYYKTLKKKIKLNKTTQEIQVKSDNKVKI